MASSIQQRTKDHWSVRLHIKHPSTRNRTALIVLVALQALLLVLTASSIATGGGLYGCSGPCGTVAQPTTPAFAVLLGMIMLLLPIVIGFLSATWQGAIGAAVVPWVPAILIGANSLLAPIASVVPGEPITTKGHTSAPLVSHFGPPFWLDSTHVLVLLLSLTFFALLGWLG
ncbi:MAG: hypothetical protein ACRDHP_11885, partial [Ktedonobacterales bacterium]